MPRSAVIVLTASFLAAPVSGQPALDITLKQGTAREAQTRDQLRRLVTAYDVSPWIYTKAIVVDERAIPHSHPTLTLSARHVKDDELLLSTFVHEELHWFVAGSKDGTAAIKELRVMFPTVPAQPPEGANGEESTYLHLIVCFLEYQADKELLGELKARQVMDFWAIDHYTWVYKTVLQREGELGSVLAKHKLLPA